MLKSVRPLVENGFAVHLLYPETKKPIGTDWAVARVLSWEALAKRWELKSDALNADCNFGVRPGKYSKVKGGYLHLIDLDIRVAEEAEEAEQRLKKLFKGVEIARLPCVRSGNETGKSRHFYFVCKRAFTSRVIADSGRKILDSKGKPHSTWQIEIFGSKKQAVLPPSIHPDTGFEYRWIVHPNFDEGIPIIDEDLIGDLIFAGKDRKPEREASKERLGLSFGQAEDMLDYVRDWAEDYHKWRDVGMALKHEFGEDGWILFDRWSRNAPAYDKRKNREIWNAFKVAHADPITMRTVRLESRNRQDVEALASAENDLPDLDEDGEDAPKEIAPGQIITRNDLPPTPEHLLSIPGVLQEVVDYYNATAHKPQPLFAIQCALAIGSVVCARYWTTEEENFTSLYLVNLGESGSGKEHARTVIHKIMKAADRFMLVGPDDYTSEAAVRSELQCKPRHIGILDEFGRYLKGSRNSNSNGMRAEVQTIAMSLFGILPGTLPPKAYSTHGMTAQQIEEVQNRYVERPALSLLAMAPPSNFFGVLTSDDVEGGFLNRMVVVQTPIGRQMRQAGAKKIPVPKSLIKWIQYYSFPELEGRDENDLTLVDYPRMPGDPNEVPFHPSCTPIREAMEREIFDRQNKLSAVGMADLLARTVELAMRIALIVALSDDAAKVMPKHLKWARDHVFHHQFAFVDTCIKQLGRSEHHKIADRIAERIIERGEDGMGHREIVKYFRDYRSLSSRDSAEVEQLMKRDHGIVNVKVRRGKRGPLRQLFILAKFAAKIEAEE